jgi:hypothetical protein
VQTKLTPRRLAHLDEKLESPLQVVMPKSG